MPLQILACYIFAYVFCRFELNRHGHEPGDFSVAAKSFQIFSLLEPCIPNPHVIRRSGLLDGRRIDGWYADVNFEITVIA